MRITNDQYEALGELQRWYRSGRRQVYEISGTIGTGLMQTVNDFLLSEEFEPYEVCYLTYNQKTIMTYFEHGLHCYYLPSRIYKYHRQTDLSNLDFLDPYKIPRSEWIRTPRNRIRSGYKLFVVLDSLLMDSDELENLREFGKPILLIRDPALIPAHNSCRYNLDPDYRLNEINSALLSDPISYFAVKLLTGEKIKIGGYDTVTVVSRKSLNLYNLKYTDMTITMGEDLSDKINMTYRKKIKHYNDSTKVGERVICMSDMYGHMLKNKEEPSVRCYLRTGVVGRLTKCWVHAPGTRFVPCEFQADWWDEPFKGLMMDRSLMTPANIRGRRQIEPEDPTMFRYAYALPVALTRVGNWDRCTVICDTDLNRTDTITRSMLYTAVTRCDKRLTLCV